MIGVSAEQTMRDQYLARRERLGMALTPTPRVQRPIALLAAPERYERAEPVKPYSVQSDLSWRQIVQEVIEKHEVSIREFLGKGRHQKVVSARKECAYRLITERGMTYAAVAEKMGYKEHSAIVHLVDCYAKIIGADPRPARDIADKHRADRNKSILDRLNNGAFVAELSKEHGLSTWAIRRIAKGMGFDFSQGAEQRSAKAIIAMNAGKREATRAAKKLDAAARKAARDAKFEKQRQKDRKLLIALSDQYWSIGDAADAIGVNKSTLRFKARRLGVVFRNKAIAMPMKVKETP